jgi:hypothetical protein
MSPKQRDEDPSGCYVDRKLLGENGQGGIRTHDTREGIPVFETGSFSHSDTCPDCGERYDERRKEKA